MKIQNRVALVTGANRGLGLAFTRGLLAAGASKVYAAARDPSTIRLPGVHAIALDVTRDDSVAAAVAAAGDVDLLINNAGVSRRSSLLAGDAIDKLEAELETNLFGVLRTSRAFAPVLARNGGGAIVNMLSVLSWVAIPTSSTYSTSKSAAWGLTNALRHELRGQGTQVVGVHVGYIDTDMTSGITAPKLSPEEVVRAVLGGVEAGQDEVLVDELSQQVKQGLAATPGVYTVAQ
jgi:NAD(P)-dependent dehydrogenase (short-subunit alcohol dehydrogenase family)